MYAAKVKRILDILERMYPDAECALVHMNNYELIVAVALSAQTTDKSVNKITPELFKAYPTAEALAKADVNDVMDIIHTIGMYKVKSKNIIALANKLQNDYGGNVPSSYEELESLPGVGRKTANVVRAVGFNIPSLAVDTHVFRTGKRIGFSNGNTVDKVERDLMKIIPKKRWIRAHHSLIFHGRNLCTARNPKCNLCDIMKYCEYTEKSVK